MLTTVRKLILVGNFYFQAFLDGLALRCGWEPLKTPVMCPCGELFTLSHSLQCNKGGHTQMRPLKGESFVHKTTTTEDEARLDIRANGLWDSRFCRTFFDVKRFNPLARICPKNVNEAYNLDRTPRSRKIDKILAIFFQSIFTNISPQISSPGL